MEEIPTLIVAPEGEPRAVVLWFHGFGVDKETHRPELERIARAGYLAVGVDAAGHGARRDPELSAKQAAPREQAFATMKELADATAHDAARLIERWPELPVAVAGVSMGAYVVYRAAALIPRVQTAVAILGEPIWPDPIEAFDDVALLSITGERDENVPPRAAREFHERLAARPERRAPQRYVEIEGEQHLVTMRAWERMMSEMLEWIGRAARGIENGEL